MSRSLLLRVGGKQSRQWANWTLDLDVTGDSRILSVYKLSKIGCPKGEKRNRNGAHVTLFCILDP